MDEHVSTNGGGDRYANKADSVRIHWDHEPTPNPSQERNYQDADERLPRCWYHSGIPGKCSCQPGSVLVSAPKEAAPKRRRGFEQKRKQGKPP